jgi:glutaredoxin
MAKQKLNEGGYEYQEIDVTESEENMKLAEKYGVYLGGTIIDSETGEIVVKL